MQSLHSKVFDNGVVLLAEAMDWLQSAAMAILVPAGCAYEPASRLGLSSLACEMVQRGCGPRDSRRFVEDLDRLGVDRSAGVSPSHVSFGAAMMAEHLLPVLEIYADVVRRPHLPESQFEEARAVCLQEVRALEDDLDQKLIQHLKLRHYGPPWGRWPQGTVESIESICVADVHEYFDSAYRPAGTIVSVAGRVDWPRLEQEVGRLLADWQPRNLDSTEAEPPARGYHHLPCDSNQMHIGIAFPSVPYSHPDYFQARGAVGVLSDGMSSRLFTEVRERRGLVYSVFATCHSLYDRGSVLCYAGTSTERAQETLDVLRAELARLAEGVEPNELDRLKARIKSSLIMQQESSAARAGAMASDWYHLARVLTLDELSRIIDQLSCESINRYLAENPPRDFTIVTLGERPLEVPLAVSSSSTG